MTSMAAKLNACSPEAHIRFTLVPGTDSGNPAISGARRAMFSPCSSPWVTQPSTTSSTIFGSIPGATGVRVARPSNPPQKDPPHSHGAWLTRETTAVHEQFVERDIPAYFSYAKRFSLCDNYYTDVAGPSTPNHLMLLCADSPIIDNPPRRNAPTIQIRSSLPKSLEQSRLTWRSYGGYAIDYMAGVNSKWKLPSDQFQVDAAAGRLPSGSWVYSPL